MPTAGPVDRSATRTGTESPVVTQVAEGAPGLGGVRGGQRDPSRTIPFVEGQQMTGHAPGDHVGRQPTTPLGGHALPAVGPPAGQHVGERTVADRPSGRERPDDELLVTGQRGQGLQGGHVADPGQYDSRAEEGCKAFGSPGPSLSGLGQVLQAGQRDDALTSPFADHGRQVGKGGDVGHLVEGQQQRGAYRRCRLLDRRRMAGVGGPPDVLQQADHHRGDRGLVVGRRRDVDGVSRLDEPGGIERGVGGGLQRLVGSEPGQRARGGRPDAAELPGVGGRDAVQQIAGQLGGAAGGAGQDLLGREGLMAIDPGQKGAHVGSVEGGGVQHGRQQGLGPLGPVRPAPRVPAVAVDGRSHLHQRPAHGQGPRPGAARLERRPSQRNQLSGSADRAARVEQVAPTQCRSCRHRGIEHIGFGRRRDHRSVGGQHVGNDQ